MDFFVVLSGLRFWEGFAEGYRGILGQGAVWVRER